MLQSWSELANAIVHQILSPVILAGGGVHHLPGGGGGDPPYPEITGAAFACSLVFFLAVMLDVLQTISNIFLPIPLQSNRLSRFILILPAS